MTMNMSMTLSVFVMVVIAATVVGSTPLEDKDLNCEGLAYHECCRNEMRICIVECSSVSDADSCWDYCYYSAATNCECHPQDGCCPDFLESYSPCLFHDGLDENECWEQARYVPCW
uniref:Ctr_26_TN conopeptide n=1 Tax=Conus tribblei TaxID=101761 RepID=A0A0C9S5X8_CONTD